MRAVVARHREAFGRLDVLVNNAGVGIGATADEHQTKYVDMQIDVNIRAIVLFYRECAELLRAAGGEHGNALVVNMASMAGKSPQPWLSVYSATKAAVVAYTTAMNKELNGAGVKSVAFCPGFVDTDMSDFVKDSIPAEPDAVDKRYRRGAAVHAPSVAELRDPRDRLPAPRRDDLARSRGLTVSPSHAASRRQGARRSPSLRAGSAPR